MEREEADEQVNKALQVLKDQGFLVYGETRKKFEKLFKEMLENETINQI